MYKSLVPICPRCSSTIHVGADDQCPACSYNLLAANKIFGDKKVEFTRVVDAAGVLNHAQRLDLLQYLAKVERYIPPVALCIYITNHGVAKDFRQHAHWILNHAQIHRASFGPRDEEAASHAAPPALSPDLSPEVEVTPALPNPDRPGWITRTLNNLRNAFLPKVPPPAQQRWMLVLVVDVQLEQACFSWGYQLDPYINPESINSCILGAKFQFRERAMLTGLKLVMKKAARQIASESRRVNAELRRRGRLQALLTFLTASLVLGAPTPAEAATPQQGAEPAAASPQPQDDTAEEVTPAPSAEAPAAPAPAPEPGAAATFESMPRWQSEDYRHLMDGELKDAYAMLFPPADKVRADKRFSTPDSHREDDHSLQKKYHDGYKKFPKSGLLDAQGLLSVEERQDVEHVLRSFNDYSNFRIHVAVYRASQKLPAEFAVHNLIKHTVKDLEHVVLLLYPLGDAQKLDLGYSQIETNDPERYEWLRRVRAAAAGEGNGVESLLLAVHEIHSILKPISKKFAPPPSEDPTQVKRVKIDCRSKVQVKEPSLKDKFKAYLENKENHPQIFSILGVLAGIAALGVAICYFRRAGVLLESREDVRLASPYGAGISRYVRYLEGKEAPKKKDYTS